MLTTLQLDLTTLHSTPMETLQHLPLKRDPQAQREMNECQEFSWLLEFCSVKVENNLLLPRPLHLTQKRTIRKKTPQAKQHPRLHVSFCLFVFR